MHADGAGTKSSLAYMYWKETGDLSVWKGIAQDALIMNDGIVKFNKADKFTKVSDSTMIAGTNVDGNKKLARAITHGPGASIDYNRLSAAIVSAMKSAKFVATVKPDLLFKGNKYG